jgi:hypothetical protein
MQVLSPALAMFSDFLYTIYAYLVVKISFRILTMLLLWNDHHTYFNVLHTDIYYALFNSGDSTSVVQCSCKLCAWAQELLEESAIGN